MPVSTALYSRIFAPSTPEIGATVVDTEIMAMPDRDRDQQEDHGLPDYRSMPGDVHPWVLVELSRLRRDTDKVALRQSFADAALLEAKGSMKTDIDELKKEVKEDIGSVRTSLNVLSSDIKNGVRWIMGTFATAFILAFVAFVVKGGLNVPG